MRGQRRYRDFLLIVVGINTALCISDLLELQVEHFLDDLQRIRQRFLIKERKRGKRQEVVVNDSVKEALKEYLKAYPGIGNNPEYYISFNNKANSYNEPIKRVQSWKFIHSICHEVGLQGNYGTHSLRKTWGYHARMQSVDLALIMLKLNHESIAYTKRYPGITDAELQAVSQRLNL